MQPTEKYGMICLSTAHLSSETRCRLEDPLDEQAPIAYDKGGYGWFVPVDNENVPDDLVRCLSFAKDADAQWVMFDCDGPIEAGLPTYDEEVPSPCR